jgi:flagellar biosynthetic protein FliR
MFPVEDIVVHMLRLATPYLETYVLLAIRIGIVFVIAPFPGRIVPARVRLVLSVAVGMVITMSMPSHDLFTGSSGLYLTSIISEIIYGTALAFALWFALCAMVLCGQMAGMQMGFGLRASFDPTSGIQANAIARVAILAWAPIALDFGAHHFLIRAFALPPSAITPAGESVLIERAMIIGDAAINGSYDMFALALVGAGPVFALSMLSHAGIGAISRAVPNAMIMGEALGGAAVLGMVATGVSAMSWIGMSESNLAIIVEAFGV